MAELTAAPWIHVPPLAALRRVSLASALLMTEPCFLGSFGTTPMLWSRNYFGGADGARLSSHEPCDTMPTVDIPTTYSLVLPAGAATADVTLARLVRETLALSWQRLQRAVAVAASRRPAPPPTGSARLGKQPSADTGGMAKTAAETEALQCVAAMLQIFAANTADGSRDHN